MGIDVKQEYQLLYNIRKILLRAAKRIAALNQKVEAISNKGPEMIALFIYTAAHLGMAVVHEPFFDEAEAWQIARSASVKTLLFETTHYEGHPPLWHLILMPLAKMGAPYELSLTLASLVFAGGAVFLILRYAPFPRLIRILLPFTYFYFYQYGVISRVYCVMLLEFILLAMAYKTRNEKPARYVVILMLLCVTSAYGIVIAGGLALVWLWEIWDRQGVRGLVSRWVRDRRIWQLALLLVVVVCVILQIMPREDTYAPGRNEAKFIRNHHLDQYRIISAWIVNRDKNGEVKNVDINLCDQAVNLAPYFEHNLFFNFNDGRDDRNYITHMRLTEEKTQEA